MDPFHLQLARLVQRAYLPLFKTDPKDVAISDLGFCPVDIVYGTDPGGDTVPYGILANHATRGLTLAIRGTETGAQWIADAAAFLRQPTGWDGLSGLVHQGFYDITQSLETTQGEPLVSWLATSSQLTVVGHSLGAAMATLVAMRAKAALLVSLAGPRVGDGGFVASGVARMGAYTRYVVGSGLLPWGDAVPELPPPFPLPFRQLPTVFSLPIPPGTFRSMEGLDNVKKTAEALHAIETYISAMEAIP